MHELYKLKVNSPQITCHIILPFALVQFVFGNGCVIYMLKFSSCPSGYLSHGSGMFTTFLFFPGHTAASKVHCGKSHPKVAERTNGPFFSTVEAVESTHTQKKPSTSLACVFLATSKSCHFSRIWFCGFQHLSHSEPKFTLGVGMASSSVF